MKCEYCDREPVYYATSEGDPWVLACDRCCGEFSDDGEACRTDDPESVLVVINRMDAWIHEARERESSCDETAEAERAACERIVRELIESVQSVIGTTYPNGAALNELVAACTALSKAQHAIAARGKDGAK